MKCYWAIALKLFFKEILRATVIGVLAAVLIVKPSLSGENVEQEQALDYLESIPRDTKIFVSPTYIRLYEVVVMGDDKNILGQIKTYKKETYRIFRLLNMNFFPSISIYSYDGSEPGELNYFMGHSLFTDGYKKAVSKLGLSRTSCGLAVLHLEILGLPVGLSSSTGRSCLTKQSVGNAWKQGLT